MRERGGGSLHLRHLQSSTDAHHSLTLSPGCTIVPSRALQGPRTWSGPSQPCTLTKRRIPEPPFALSHPLTPSSIAVLHLWEIKKAGGAPHSSCSPKVHLNISRRRRQSAGLWVTYNPPFLTLTLPNTVFSPPAPAPPHGSLRSDFHWSCRLPVCLSGLY